ncbi:UNVERIFIED_CONTAM: hypothetical protein NCL1_21247 [Trichonephila clavipes]
MAEKERRVTIPLMVRYVDDIQFVEDDNDTVSETEPSSDIGTLPVGVRTHDLRIHSQKGSLLSGGCYWHI